MDEEEEYDNETENDETPMPEGQKGNDSLSRDANFDCYTILNVKRNATSSEIRAAYMKLATVFHPDKHSRSSRNRDKISVGNGTSGLLPGTPSIPDVESAENEFIRIEKAYKILSDPLTKLAYDEEGIVGVQLYRESLALKERQMWSKKEERNKSSSSSQYENEMDGEKNDDENNDIKFQRSLFDRDEVDEIQRFQKTSNNLNLDDSNNNNVNTTIESNSYNNNIEQKIEQEILSEDDEFNNNEVALHYKYPSEVRDLLKNIEKIKEVKNMNKLSLVKLETDIDFDPYTWKINPTIKDMTLYSTLVLHTIDNRDNLFLRFYDYIERLKFMNKDNDNSEFIEKSPQMEIIYKKQTSPKSPKSPPPKDRLDPRFRLTRQKSNPPSPRRMEDQDKLSDSSSSMMVKEKKEEKKEEKKTILARWKSFFVSIPTFLQFLSSSTSLSSFVNYLVLGHYVPIKKEEDDKGVNTESRKQKSTSKFSDNNNNCDKSSNSSSNNSNTSNKKSSQSLLLKNTALKDTIELISSVRSVQVPAPALSIPTQYATANQVKSYQKAKMLTRPRAEIDLQLVYNNNIGMGLHQKDRYILKYSQFSRHIIAAWSSTRKIDEETTWTADISTPVYPEYRPFDLGKFEMKTTKHIGNGKNITLGMKSIGKVEHPYKYLIPIDLIWSKNDNPYHHPSVTIEDIGLLPSLTTVTFNYGYSPQIVNSSFGTINASIKVQPLAHQVEGDIFHSFSIQTMKELSFRSRVSLDLSIGTLMSHSPGVVLTSTYYKGNIILQFPVILTDIISDPWGCLIGAALKGIGLSLLESMMISKRREKKRQLLDTIEKDLLSSLIEERNRASSQIRLLLPTVEKIISKEKRACQVIATTTAKDIEDNKTKKKGLIILEAKYGFDISQPCDPNWYKQSISQPSSASSSRNNSLIPTAKEIFQQLLSGCLDVTIPVQYWVKDSILELNQGVSLPRLYGFYDILMDPWFLYDERIDHFDFEYLVARKGKIRRQKGQGLNPYRMEDKEKIILDPSYGKLYIKYIYYNRVYETIFEEEQTIRLPDPSEYLSHTCIDYIHEGPI